MSLFENYTLVVYETSSDYHDEVPEHRFVAYLKEIPEASLHEYGPTQEKAILGLREQFDAMVKEAKERGSRVPEPEKRDDEEFSGRIVLRMPPWLHRQIDRLADEESLSTNSYIVNRLIRTVTLEEVIFCVRSSQEDFVRQLGYKIQTKRAPSKFAKKRVGALELYTSVQPEYKKVV
jgi:predicted HicB family RNase H-like nuclease